MNAKELFMLIDNIDEQFVEEAWEGGIESEKPVKVVFEHRPSPVIRLAAAAAACVIMFGAGMFIGIKFFGSVPVLPGSETESSSSDSETSTDDNDSEQENSDSESTDSDIEKPASALYDFNFIMSQGKATSGDYSVAEKQDNLDYALINIENTTAAEDNPIIAYICDENKKVLSETIEITGNGTYKIHYEVLRGAGAPCVLWMELPDDSYVYQVFCAGIWAP